MKKVKFRYDTKELIQVFNQAFRDYGMHMDQYEKLIEKESGTYKKSGAAGHILYDEIERRVKKLKKIK